MLCFFWKQQVPVRMSNTSTETACLKFIFAKFACSMKKGAGYISHSLHMEFLQRAAMLALQALY